MGGNCRPPRRDGPFGGRGRVRVCGEEVSLSLGAFAKEASKLRQRLANVEEVWVRKRISVLLDLEGQRTHQICSFMEADNFWIMSHSKSQLEQMQGDLIQEA